MIVLTTFIHHLPGGLHSIVFEGHFPCLLTDPDAGLLLTTAAVLNQIIANDGALGGPIDKKPPTRIIPNGITLEGDAVSCHGLGLRPPVNPTHLVSNNGILLNKIVAVLVSDVHPIPSVAFEPVAASNTTPHPPAEEKPILIVGDRSAVGHRGSLGTTSRMQAKAGTPLHHTLIHLHIIGLLKTDSIPHRAGPGADLNHASSQLADKINCRLQGPMILADDIRFVLAHTNHHCRTGVKFVLGILATRLVPKADSDRQGDPPSKARKKRFHRRSLPQTKGQLLGQSRSIIHPHPNAETTNDRPGLL